MKLINFRTVVICMLVVFGLINTAFGSNNVKIIDESEIVDIDNSLIIDVSDKYDYADFYPVMYDPIRIENMDIDYDTSHIEIIDTPVEFCWNNYNNMDLTTSAKNQRNCGSCWAFGAMGVIESMVNIRENTDIDIDLSEQYLLSCVPAAGSCNGGTTPSPFSFIMNTTEEGNNCNGVIFEHCLPYYADDDIPCSDKDPDWIDYLVPISDWGEAWIGAYTPETVSQIKSLVYDNGPVYALVLVDNSFRNFGAISHKSTAYLHYRTFNDLILNHAILIVGWKDDPSIGNGGYWICKNSWDTNWGYDGFFNIEYGSHLVGYYIAWADYDPDSFNCPPVADCGGFYEAGVNEEIIFDASKSFDAEGEIISYSWDFGDGNIVEGISPTYDYDEPGFYEVVLTVCDNENRHSTDTTVVAVDEEFYDIDFQGGNGLVISINNPSDYDLFGCDLSIIISGGVQNMDYRNERIEYIPRDYEYSMTLPLVGFGRGTIDFMLEDFEISKNYFILGPFVIIR
jgi:hypothetical protein